MVRVGVQEKFEDDLEGAERTAEVVAHDSSGQSQIGADWILDRWVLVRLTSRSTGSKFRTFEGFFFHVFREICSCRSCGRKGRDIHEDCTPKL